MLNLWQGEGFANHYYYYIESLPPNTLLYIFIACLQLIVPAEVSGKITLSIYIILFNLGFFRYCFRISKDHLFRFMGFLAVFNLFFYKGFLSYLIGVTVLFWVLPIFYNQNFSPKRQAIKILLASFVLYLIHGFIFGIFLIALIVWILIHWDNSKINDVVKYILAIVPSSILLLIYFFNMKPPHEQPLEFYSSFLSILNSIRYGITSFQRIVLLKNILPSTLLNIFFLISIFVILVKQRRHFRFKSFNNTFLIVLIALMFSNPVYRIGNFYPPSPRLIPIIFIVLAGSFWFSRPNRKIETAVLSLAVLMTIFHFVYFWQFDNQTNRLIKQMKDEYSTSESPLVIGKAPFEDFDKSPLNLFSGITQPYIRTGHMLNADTLRFLLSIQPNGIVRTKRIETTRTILLIDSLFDASVSREQIIETVSENKHLISESFDKIFILGTDTTRSVISELVYPDFRESKEFFLGTLLTKESILNQKNQIQNLLENYAPVRKEYLEHY